jgi:hypothetical protein
MVLVFGETKEDAKVKFKDLLPGDQFIVLSEVADDCPIAIYTKLVSRYVEETIYGMALDGFPVDKAELRLNSVTNYGSCTLITDMEDVQKIVTPQMFRDRE